MYFCYIVLGLVSYFLPSQLPCVPVIHKNSVHFFKSLCICMPPCLEQLQMWLLGLVMMGKRAVLRKEALGAVAQLNNLNEGFCVFLYQFLFAAGFQKSKHFSYKLCANLHKRSARNDQLVKLVLQRSFYHLEPQSKSNSHIHIYAG